MRKKEGKGMHGVGFFNQQVRNLRGWAEYKLSNCHCLTRLNSYFYTFIVRFLFTRSWFVISFSRMYSKAWQNSMKHVVKGSAYSRSNLERQQGTLFNYDYSYLSTHLLSPMGGAFEKPLAREWTNDFQDENPFASNFNSRLISRKGTSEFAHVFEYCNACFIDIKELFRNSIRIYLCNESFSIIWNTFGRMTGAF